LPLPRFQCHVPLSRPPVSRPPSPDPIGLPGSRRDVGQGLAASHHRHAFLVTLTSSLCRPSLVSTLSLLFLPWAVLLWAVLLWAVLLWAVAGHGLPRRRGQGERLSTITSPESPPILPRKPPPSLANLREGSPSHAWWAPIYAAGPPQAPSSPANRAA
jgi:hypothetical protein